VLRHLPASAPVADSRENTVIGVIATNARLNKEHTNIVARMAHDGIARAVVPAHTAYDGDTLFALSTGTHPADSTVVGAFAAQVVAQAIRNAVLLATSLHDVRARRDWLAS
jgi:L-aminopeptidase/D-esterase-like protein